MSKKIPQGFFTVYIAKFKEIGIGDKDIAIIGEKVKTLQESGLPQSEIVKLIEKVQASIKFRIKFIKDPKVLAKIQADGKFLPTIPNWMPILDDKKE